MKKNTTTQILALLGILALFTIMLGVAIVILQMKGVEQWRMTMAIMTLQNIGLFVLPAIIMARIFNPGKTMSVMQLNRLPGIKHITMMLLIYIASIPMMNMLIEWNESWHLPEALSSVENWLRASEDSATAATEQLLNVTSIGQLILVIIVVGILTGIGEEFIFRGTLQRIFLEQSNKIHCAIWVTAFIFSAIHMQFYGFLPRMLIGAFLGYLLVWSGSLWLPVLAHALNNSMAVISYHYESVQNAYWIGETQSTINIIISTIITLALIYSYIKWIRIKE